MRRTMVWFSYLCVLISTPVISTEMELLWSIEGKFNMPESAAYDPAREVIYVSNVNHYAKDGNGFISRVSADGSKLELDWLKGLHSPTGLAVRGNTLYAVDFDALVIIDLVEEKIINRIHAPDAEESPVLNDVAISDSGDIYVSGSRSRTIYQLNDGELEVWVKDNERLKNANGLLVNNNYLLHGGEKWTVFDKISKEAVSSLSPMGKGLKEFDGIAEIGTGNFIVTLIDDPKLWLLREGKSPQPFSDDEIKGIDISYDDNTNRLFVPRVGNTLSAYQITR
ncbi:hypothetical protein EYS14_00035 [Alteromonadaceae bacterium M269]|nr:hypothetical protein EYS14_00035 [Alteromonadaceae bacterium M269]